MSEPALGNPPPRGPVTPLTDAERAASLRAVWAARPTPVTIFAYGSLMWSPCFEVAAQSAATLAGYRRKFAIWSVVARGTPEAPGLGFALDREDGADCRGIAFTLPETATEADLLPLWEREMWTDTYRPVWLPIVTPQGEVRALTFVVRRDHRQYAGDLPVAEKAAFIARAAGKFGTCRDYLADTVDHLRTLGIVETDLEELLAAVDALPAAGGT